MGKVEVEAKSVVESFRYALRLNDQSNDVVYSTAFEREKARYALSCVLDVIEMFIGDFENGGSDED